jgi:hypothetical protein
MILDDPQNSDMIEWLPHGLSFYIRRKTEFTKHVLPKYFARFAKYSSFTRKLSRWGFTRVTRGADAGAYYHRLFQRNHRELALQMTCQIVVLKTNSSSNVAMSAVVEQTSVDDGTAALYYPETRGGCTIPPNSTDSSYLDPHHYQLPFPRPPISQQHYEHGTMVPSSAGGAQRHVSFHHPESTTFYHPYGIPMPPAPHSMYDYPPAHQFHRRHEPSNDARTMSSHVNILTEQPQLGPSSHYIGNSGPTQHLSIDYLNHQDKLYRMSKAEPSNNREKTSFYPPVFEREANDQPDHHHPRQYLQQYDNDQYQTNSFEPFS